MPTHTNDDKDEPLPHDLDDFLMTLQRRLAESDPQIWRHCTSRLCRRARRCVDDAMLCVTTQPSDPMTEDERAEITASLREALRTRIG